MKTKFRSIISMAVMGLAFALVQPWAASGAIVTSAPVPGSYIWDGRQFVGTAGAQYYYLGPGNVWMPMDSGRMSYFRGWERAHPKWRMYTTPNTRYRTMGPVRPQPVAVIPPPPGTRSGGMRPQPVPPPAAQPQPTRPKPNSNPYMIPRLKQSPGGPAYGP